MDKATEVEPESDGQGLLPEAWMAATFTSLPNYAGTDERFRELVEEGLKSLREGRGIDLDEALAELALEFGVED